MRWSIVLILISYLWINIPSLHDGLFNVIDNVQVTRVEAMYSELSSHQFPVRYVDAFGHGAGSFIFKYYSPLVYYLGAVFHYMGFSVIQSVKLIYLLMTAIGTIGIWVLLKSQRMGLLSSTMGTIVFVVSPYLYHDFFHRGSLTEASAFMLLPWVWWAYLRIMKEASGVNIAVGALSLGALILTHSLTGVMVVGTLVILTFLPPLRLKNTIKLVVAILLGCGLAAFSLIPSLYEKNIIQYENNSLVQTGYLDHPVSLVEQFTIYPSGKTAYLGFGLMITYLMLVGGYMMFPALRKKYGKVGLFVMIVGTGGLLLMLPSGGWLWANIIYLRYFQFPFRLLTVVTTALVVGYAILIENFRDSKVFSALMMLIILIPLLFSLRYYQPLGYQYGTKYTVDDPCMTNTWADEYLSKWTTKCLLKPTKDLVSPPVDNLIATDKGRTIKFDAPKAGEYIIAKYYFPEWSARDGNGLAIKVEPYGENGLIAVTTTKANTLVTVKMQPTTTDKVGDAVSVISLLLCAGLITLSFFDFRKFLNNLRVR